MQTEQQAFVELLTEELCDIVATVCGEPKVTDAERLSDLGIDSLGTLRIQLTVRSRLGYAVTMRELFALQTPRRLAVALAGRDPVQPEATAGDAAGGDACPQALSPYLEEFWLHGMVDPGITNNVQLNLRIEGKLDRARLLQALRLLVSRHDALRLAVSHEPGGTIGQRVCEPIEVQVELDDRRLTNSSPAAVGEALAALMLNPAARSDRPGLQASLLQATDGVSILSLNIHHLHVDGHSLPILFRDIAALYASGDADSLPPVASCLPGLQPPTGDEHERLHRWWLGKLSDQPAAASLGLSMQANAGEWHDCVLPAELSRSLLRFAAESGATAFAIVLTTVKAVLARTCSELDVPIGLPVSLRGAAESGADAVGCLMNTVVLRSALREGMSFAQMVVRCRDELADVMDGRRFPLPTLRRMLQGQGAAVDLFKVLVAEQVPQPAPTAAGAAVFRPLGESVPEVRAELELHCHLAGPTSTIRIGVRQSADNRHFAEGLAASLPVALRWLMDHAEDPVLLSSLPCSLWDEWSCEAWQHRTAPWSSLALMSAARRDQVVSEWNSTVEDLGPFKPVHVLIGEQARSTPDAVAVEFESATLSYSELDRRAEMLACTLADRAPSRFVGIYMERGLEMILAILAVLKAGKAYVPLEPTLPGERVGAMLDDARPDCVLTQGPLEAALAAVCAGSVRQPIIVTVALDRGVEPGASPFTAALPRVRGDSTAYMIYTSGSTGQPKGAMNSHAGLRNRLLWMQRHFEVSRDDRVLQKTPFGFDVSVWELLLPLMCGGTLVFARPGEHVDPRYIADTVRSRRISLLHFVPAMLSPFLAACHGLPSMPSLRHIVASGEALTHEQVEQTLNLFGPVLTNLYGPTEAAIDVTFWPARRLTSQRPVPIGRPIANTRIYIVDENLEPVPPGVVGELCIGGVNVGQGYLNLVDKTAERFRPDPFSADGRLYRTGDLARFQSDGEIEYIGRADNQVKVRGVRIELGDIEARLASHAQVRACAVVAAPDAAGLTRLSAFVVLHEPLPAAALRQHLAEGLPSAMLPSSFAFLASLPLTGSGKLDRRALKSRLGTAASEAPDQRPLETPLEQALCALFASVLGRELPAVDHDFFNIGGHSLSMIQLVHRIEQSFGVRVGVTEAMRCATIGRLAGLIEQRPRAAGDTDAAKPSSSELTHAPLTNLQEGIWLIQQLDPASIAYNIHATVQLQTAFQQVALTAALQRLLSRHSALSVSICQEQGRVVQRLQPAAVILHVEQARDLDAARECMRHFSAQPFDLSAGPKLRCLAVLLDEGSWTLTVLSHHIVVDGWSMDILLRELLDGYRGLHGGMALPDAPAPAPYLRWCADWESRRHTAQRREQLAHWQALLRPRPSPSRLNGIAGGRRSGRCSLHHARLDTAAWHRLRALAAAQRCSVFTVALAVFQVLLHKQTRRRDVVLGVAVAKRGPAEQDLIGMLVNTVPLRATIDVECSFDEHLRRTSDALLSAIDHSDVSYAEIVASLQPPTPGADPTVISVLFAMQDERWSVALRARDASRVDFANIRGDSKFDLSVSWCEEDDGLGAALDFIFDDGLLDLDAVQSCAQGFAELLLQLGDRPGGALGSLRTAGGEDEAALGPGLPLSPEARRQVLAEFNDTRRSFPSTRSIHEMFEARAAAHPHAVAVVHGSSRLSYAELNRRANQLAHLLLGLGVQPDNRVALCFDRGTDMVVALLGVLKSGAAYVPMDPAYPVERRAGMLTDSAPRALLTQSALVEELTATGLPVIALDDDAANAPLRGQPAHNPDRSSGRPQASSDLAYVIYTSGSTGRPKGVMVEHRSVINLWRGLEEALFYRCKAPSAIGLNASIAFDSSVKMLVQLLSGHRLVVIPEALRMDAHALAGFLRNHEVEAFDCTPSQLEALVATGLLEQDLGRLHTVLVGGEAISTALWDRLSAAQGIGFYNLYGPTECTVDATTCCLSGAGPVPVIGRPIANVQVRILDAEGNLLPVGVPGEIHIGGAGVARGYLNQPELTAERFVPDPFAEGGVRLYKTGDIGRWRLDGQVEYLYRNDFQVKLRGFRIELGEIEATLRQFEGVQEAAVIAREDTLGDKRLVAYVVARQGAPVNAAELRRRLVVALPEHMVPSAFVFVPALPLTVHGKLDRTAFAPPDLYAVATRDYEAPQGELESTIALTWQQLLQVARVGRHDDFFELGGNSLLALQFVSRMRQVHRLEVGLRELFRWRGVAALAQRVVPAADSFVDAPITLLPRDGSPLPLSSAQQRLWMLHQLDAAAGAAYHVPFALRLKGRLDRVALRDALARLVARHEPLRTRFVDRHGEPGQQVGAADIGFLLDELDLQGVDAALREAELARQVAAEARRPFDLAAGPPLRGRLWQLAGDEHLLLLTLHHIVCDGWSLRVLLHELCFLYDRIVRGAPDELPPLRLQYADHAAWQAQSLAAERLQAHVVFWTRHLSGAPRLLSLPTDRPRASTQSYRGAVVEIEMHSALVSALHRLAQQHGVTLFMTLLAGWAVLLARLSGQDDVVIGTPVANRRRADIEPLIGLFVNTLALRVQLDDDPSVAELLARVKNLTLDAFDHQDLPFEQVVQAIEAPRSLGYNPVFQVMLALNNTPDTRASTLQGLTLEPLTVPRNSARVDLSLSLLETSGTLTGTLEYATDLFDAATVRRLLEHWQVLLESMVQDDGQRASALPVLSASQRRQLLVEFNDTAAQPPAQPLIHRLIEARAAEDPSAIAVVVGDRHISYDELNRRANRLAHQLLALGVSLDQRVALCLPRGLDMVVGMLASMKAGAAYVPVDPAYPADRQAYMLTDSAPKAVLTHAALWHAQIEPAVPVVLMDQPAANEALAAFPTHNPDPSALGLRASHLAYVIYTSGSTGRPKGVMCHHYGLCSSIEHSIALFGIGPGSRMLQFASCSFDASVLEVTLALCSGAQLHLMPGSALPLGDALLGLLHERGITHAVLSPSALATLPAEACLPSLETVIVGGEVFPPALAAQWAGRCHVFNAYGPTEATIMATVHRCEAKREGVLPIGRPIANTKIYVLDAHRQPVPVGVAGEIYIGGAGVARGYLGQPELTSQRFVADPFSCKPGARMYCTGDIGRWLPDGDIDYLGRNDFQIKIRGFRIEPGEVEARLVELPGVREALVLACDEPAATRRLVAYLVVDGEAPPALALRRHLAPVLAEHMVPSAFVVLPDFPRLPNGKVDRSALPAPDLSAVATREFEAPANERERAIAELWQQLLRLSRVGRHDHFFELGGNSLLGLQLVSRLRSTLGLEASLRDLFARPVLSELAQGLPSSSTALPAAGNRIAIRHGERRRPLFLIHPVEGELRYAHRLVEWLDVDLPVFGFAASGFNAGQAPLERIEALAARYLPQIMEVQPRGPYRLAGWSAGGTIAYEIAHQFEQRGERVEFLGLLDTTRDHRSSRPVFDPVAALQDWLAAPMSVEQAQALRHLAASANVTSMLRHGKAKGLLPDDIDIELVARHLAVRAATVTALRTYEAPKIVSPVTLFWASGQNRSIADLGWASTTSGALQVVSVPGTHRSMMDPPHIRSLARALSKALPDRGSADPHLASDEAGIVSAPHPRSP